MSLKQKIIAITPFVSTIIFFLCGYCWGAWHPGWLAFLLIPIVPILLGVKKIKHIYPLICVLIYVLLGIFLDLWFQGWLIFLTIPIVEILFGRSNKEDEDRIDIYF